MVWLVPTKDTVDPYSLGSIRKDIGTSAPVTDAALKYNYINRKLADDSGDEQDGDEVVEKPVKMPRVPAPALAVTTPASLQAATAAPTSTVSQQALNTVNDVFDAIHRLLHGIAGRAAGEGREKQRQRLLDMFASVDVDNSGYLNHDELRCFLVLAGLTNCPDSLFDDFFAILDA